MKTWCLQLQPILVLQTKGRHYSHSYNFARSCTGIRLLKTQYKIVEDPVMETCVDGNYSLQNCLVDACAAQQRSSAGQMARSDLSLSLPVW